MRKYVSLAVAAAFLGNAAFAQSGYKVEKTFPVGGDTKYDYISLCPVNENLYVAHGTLVNIINKNTGEAIGKIENTEGVHGVAFAPEFKKGFTTNGRANTVTVFDINTNKALEEIKVGEKPDAIMYDTKTKMILVCEGRSKDLAVIDPSTNKVVKNIDLGGKLETAVTDDAGRAYINLEDKNELVVVNTKTWKVEKKWKLGNGQSPTGLAIDKKTRRLFVGCEKLMVVLNATNGKVVKEVPIGEGCDGVAFDPSRSLIFTSNGSGTLSVIKENSADDFALLENVPTKKGARTLVVDEKTHKVYLPTSENGSFEVIVLSK
jgi:YVTN family beta-propeller protein